MLTRLSYPAPDPQFIAMPQTLLPAPRLADTALRTEPAA